jgi:hypothetical protein
MVALIAHGVITALEPLEGRHTLLETFGLLTITHLTLLLKWTETQAQAGKRSATLNEVLTVWRAGCVSVALWTLCAVILLRA